MDFDFNHFWLAGGFVWNHRKNIHFQKEEEPTGGKIQTTYSPANEKFEIIQISDWWYQRNENKQMIIESKNKGKGISNATIPKIYFKSFTIR